MIIKGAGLVAGRAPNGHRPGRTPIFTHQRYDRSTDRGDSGHPPRRRGDRSGPPYRWRSRLPPRLRRACLIRARDGLAGLSGRTGQSVQRLADVPRRPPRPTGHRLAHGSRRPVPAEILGPLPTAGQRLTHIARHPAPARQRLTQPTRRAVPAEIPGPLPAAGQRLTHIGRHPGPAKQRLTHIARRRAARQRATQVIGLLMAARRAGTDATRPTVANRQRLTHIAWHSMTRLGQVTRLPVTTRLVMTTRLFVTTRRTRATIVRPTVTTRRRTTEIPGLMAARQACTPVTRSNLTTRQRLTHVTRHAAARQRSAVVARAGTAAGHRRTGRSRHGRTHDGRTGKSVQRLAHVARPSDIRTFRTRPSDTRPCGRLTEVDGPVAPAPGAGSGLIHSGRTAAARNRATDIAGLA